MINPCGATLSGSACCTTARSKRRATWPNKSAAPARLVGIMGDCAESAARRFLEPGDRGRGGILAFGALRLDEVGGQPAHDARGQDRLIREGDAESMCLERVRDRNRVIAGGVRSGCVACGKIDDEVLDHGGPFVGGGYRSIVAAGIGAKLRQVKTKGRVLAGDG